jgi:hypothetical protein
MPFCIIVTNLLFPSSVRLRNLFGAVARDVVRTRVRRPRNERYLSKPNFVQNKKMYTLFSILCSFIVRLSSKEQSPKPPEQFNSVISNGSHFQ